MSSEVTALLLTEPPISIYNAEGRKVPSVPQPMMVPPRTPREGFQRRSLDLKRTNDGFRTPVRIFLLPAAGKRPVGWIPRDIKIVVFEPVAVRTQTSWIGAM
jgi:hypothetical protein